MIICLGTTPAHGRAMTFDRLVPDTVNRAAQVTQHAAGKSINAARVLRTLARNVIATGFLGGHTGIFIREELDQIGVQHDFLAVDPPTRVCVTAIDRSANAATELIEEASALPVEMYGKLLSKLQERLIGSRALILSGKLPPNAPGDFYADCTAAAIAAGVLVVLDATGEPLRKALGKKPTVVKPNRAELQETVGIKIDSDDRLKEAMTRLVSAGPRWVVVTSGANQTVASDGDSFWKIATPQVAVVSAIGSGDAFAAGLTAGLTAGESVPQACRLGAACGAANAMTAFAGDVRLPDIENLFRQISVLPF